MWMDNIKDRTPLSVDTMSPVNPGQDLLAMSASVLTQMRVSVKGLVMRRRRGKRRRAVMKPNIINIANLVKPLAVAAVVAGVVIRNSCLSVNNRSLVLQR